MKRNRRATDPARRSARRSASSGASAAPLALALLLGAACEPASDEAVADLELKVLSYNLRHNVDFYEERMELMADGIAALAPDVVGLQEIEIAVEQGEVLLEMVQAREPSLAYELRQVMKPGAAALSGEGVGILSRFPTSDAASLELEDGRVSLFARVHDAQGHSFSFVSTHLSSDGGDELRARQAADTLAFLEQHAPADDARVLVGDMNADADDPAVTSIVDAGFVDTYLEAHGEEATQAEGNTSPVVLGTDSPAQSFSRRIDYVFAREGAGERLEVVASDVVLDEPRADGLYPSDHLGVMTTLRLSQSEPR